MIRRWMGAWAAAALVVTLLAGSAFSEPAPPAAHATYDAELRRLAGKRDWAGLERLARTALQALDAEREVDVAGVDLTSRYLIRALTYQRRLPEAEPVYDHLIALDAKTYGADSRELLTHLGQKARLLDRERKWVEAEALGRRALGLAERMSGPNGAEAADALETLAQILKSETRSREAEAAWRRALAIREALAPEDSEAEADRDALADLLTDQHRTGEIETLYREALAIEDARRPAGEIDQDEIDVASATLTDKLVAILEADGRVAALEPLLRRRIARQEKAGGDADELGSLYGRLGDLLQSQSRSDEAGSLFRKQLALVQTSADAKPGQAGGLIMRIAAASFDSGRFAEAEARLRSLAPPCLGRTGGCAPAAVEDVLAARAAVALARTLAWRGRAAEAEAILSRLVDAMKSDPALSPSERSHRVAVADFAAFEILSGEGRSKEARPHFDAVLAALKDPGLSSEWHDPSLLEDVGSVLLRDGRAEPAREMFDRALDGQSFMKLGDEKDTSVGRARALREMAGYATDQGYFSLAEALLMHALVIDEKALGPGAPATVAALGDLALTAQREGRLSLAEAISRRALASTQASAHVDSVSAASQMNNLAFLLRAAGDASPDPAQAKARYDEADALLRRAIEILGRLRPRDPAIAVELGNLGQLRASRGRLREAEPLLRRALSLNEGALGPTHPDTALVLEKLADLMERGRRLAEADGLRRRVLAIRRSVLAPNDPATIAAAEAVAAADVAQSRFAEAAEIYNSACAGRETSLSASNDNGHVLQTLGLSATTFGDADSHSVSRVIEEAAREKANLCEARRTLAYWGAAGGPPPGGVAATASDRDLFGLILRTKAFEAAQLAMQSAGGDALASAAALAAARAAGKEDKALAHQAAVARRDDLETRFLSVAGGSEGGSVDALEAILEARERVMAEIVELDGALSTKDDRFFRILNPDPVRTVDLQVDIGKVQLLRNDEALVLFMVPPGAERGLVFAVTKDRDAWARIGFTGDELRARIQAIRVHVEDLLGSRASLAHRGAWSFDRQSAYDLYRALFGDPDIQAVIKDKPVLLIVPSGPLTSLPPGLLVTAPPVGGAAGDADQGALRATPWLLRSKAVALLPSAASLRTLRETIPAARTAPTDPLLAFADPAFKTAPAGDGAARGPVTAMALDLDTLEDLPGALLEGRTLSDALRASPGSLLTGSAASKRALFARNDDGRLARVKVLEFATHGLVAGVRDWLPEPALVLAAADKPDDELLLASEAATLRLNADWVLLSACNTASPDQPEARGLSGLSRAFFAAGAESLLISHWSVLDDVTTRLIPDTVRAELETPGIGRAQALRRATLRIIDDPALKGANPVAWAPFTLVGEANGRNAPTPAAPLR